MQKFSRPIQIRWSDIDANRHLRHSAYYDYGAVLRVLFLSEQGLTIEKMETTGVGPILFREEAIFKREVVFTDQLTMDLECTKATPDYTRWSIRHNLIKHDGTVAAIITVDGAWIDLAKRKVAGPIDIIINAFKAMPQAPDFTEIIRER